MAESLGQVFVEVMADLSKLPHGIHEVEHAFSGLADKFTPGALLAGGAEIATGFLAAYAPVALLEHALEGYKEAAREGLQLSLEFTQAQLRLENAVKASGGAAGFTTSELMEYSETLEHATGVSTISIMEFQQRLLTFNKIHGETFERATKAGLDWSVQMGMDMPAAARILGIALSDPVRGADRLRRAGLVLTAEQKQQIKAFMAVNDLASAQGVILSGLENRFGGAGEKLATPIKKLKAAIHEATLELGNSVKQREPLKLQVKLVVLDVEKQLSEGFNLFAQASGYDLTDGTKKDQVKEAHRLADDLMAEVGEGFRSIPMGLFNAGEAQDFIGSFFGGTKADYDALRQANKDRENIDKKIRDHQEKAAAKAAEQAIKPTKADKELTGVFDLASLSSRIQESVLSKNDKLIELAEQSNKIQADILEAVEGGGGEGLPVAMP